ncbi:helix-turn-helix domain-containing protein [Streptomyces mirabilis]|uniref:helix-turn-helix domain-containing protein n=1 Tax=Streptomyces mirabilis TaxID=68239 RepID=UPI0036D1206A
MNAMVTQSSRYARGLLPHRLAAMSDQQYGRRAVEVGPTGKTVADNLARLRKVRGYSTRQLATELERKGRSVSASGITRMEKGDRVVTADDLAALAAVFGVSPVSLLLPLTTTAETPVEITGGGTVDALRAWEWGIGRLPLRTTPEHERTQLAEHRLYGMPQWLTDHVRYTVVGSATGEVQLSGELKAQLEADRERYERETGETVDPETFRRLWMQARFGGADAPSVD